MTVIGLPSGRPHVLSREVAAGVAGACADLGIEVRTVRTVDGSAGVDLILAIERPECYPVVFEPKLAAPVLVWIGEPIPPEREAVIDRILRPMPMGRLLDAATRIATVAGRRPTPGALRSWREAAAQRWDQRHNLASHRRAAGHGLRLVVTSADRSAALARCGIRAAVVPFGYHRAMAGDPLDPADGGRDIDVLCLGSAIDSVPTRRARIVAQLVDELAPSVGVVVRDGIWGPERDRLLRRARIVVNVNRLAGNFTGLRSIYVAAAGAALVTEPATDPAPFVPGVHHVAAMERGLAAAVHGLLADDARRIALARAAQAFVTRDLTMAVSLRRLIDLADRAA